MVNLQVRPCAAALTLPAIAAKHLFPKLFVQLGSHLLTRTFWAELGSRRFFVHFVQEGLALFAGKEFEEP